MDLTFIAFLFRPQPLANSLEERPPGREVIASRSLLLQKTGRVRGFTLSTPDQVLASFQISSREIPQVLPGIASGPSFLFVPLLPGSPSG